MTGPGFQTVWEAAFGAVLPIGPALRVAVPDRWVRFHALPRAKRYAEGPAEQAEILKRANDLAAWCFDEGRQIWLAAAVPSSSLRFYVRSGTAIVVGDVALPESHQVADTAADFEDEEDFVFARRMAWSRGAFDRLFTEIADDRTRAVMFDAGSSRVLAPYDGGFDVILETAAVRQTLRGAFSDWASPRGDGL